MAIECVPDLMYAMLCAYIQRNVDTCSFKWMGYFLCITKFNKLFVGQSFLDYYGATVLVGSTKPSAVRYVLVSCGIST